MKKALVKVSFWYRSILREKSLATVIMCFPIGDLFSISSFLLEGVQTCLMATCKRSKEINSDFIARI